MRIQETTDWVGTWKAVVHEDLGDDRLGLTDSEGLYKSVNATIKSVWTDLAEMSFPVEWVCGQSKPK